MPLPMTLFFAVFIGIAVLFLLRTIFIANRIDSYLKETKRGRKWVEHYGYEKSLKMMKTVAIPLGIIVPIIFIGAGIAMYSFIAKAIATGQI